MPEISTIPAAALASYSLVSRYYLALALAMVSVAVVGILIRSRALDSVSRLFVRTRRLPRPTGVGRYVINCWRSRSRPLWSGSPAEPLLTTT